MYDRVVGIMAKAPVPGEAKTRLSPVLGAERAAMLYRHMLLDTIDIVSEALDGRGAICIVCPTPAHRRRLRRMVPQSVAIVAHEQVDLIHGLDYGFRYLLGQGYRQVLLFNGDTPTLPASYLRSALDQLADDVVVLGPTLDGGYYLIGACRPQPALFRWGRLEGATICRETRERAECLGARVALLPEWYDIDTAADLERLVDEFRSHAHGAPRTRRFLKREGYA